MEKDGRSSAMSEGEGLDEDDEDGDDDEEGGAETEEQSGNESEMNEQEEDVSTVFCVSVFVGGLVAVATEWPRRYTSCTDRSRRHHHLHHESSSDVKPEHPHEESSSVRLHDVTSEPLVAGCSVAWKPISPPPC